VDIKGWWMREKIAVFGEKRSLIGIVSEPEPAARASGQPAVVLLNSGLLHRVGPNRLYVKIARQLASAGFTVMRFDLSGLGDSQRAHNLPPEVSAIQDAKHAMSFVSETRGARSFFLMGICAGADNAFQTARSDPRVAGIVMIDGFAFPTAGYTFKSYLDLLLKPRSWQRLISGKSDIWRLLKEKLTASSSGDADYAEPLWPVPDDEQVSTLLRKGVEVCLIYSSNGEAHYNYEKTLARKMRSLIENNRLQVEVIKDSDHLFSPLHIQKQLVDVIQNWAVRVTAKRQVSPQSAQA
jgi:alpha/beta superfamily hydrolase